MRGVLGGAGRGRGRRRRRLRRSELDGGGRGVDALCALDGEIDRLELDARAVGEPLELDQEARLVAVRRHRLAEHHQPAVVGREDFARLLAGGGGLLRLRELTTGAGRCPPSGSRPGRASGLITTSQKAAISADDGQRERRWSARSASWRRPRSRDEGVDGLAALLGLLRGRVLLLLKLLLRVGDLALIGGRPWSRRRRLGGRGGARSGCSRRPAPRRRPPRPRTWR